LKESRSKHKTKNTQNTHTPPTKKKTKSEYMQSRYRPVSRFKGCTDKASKPVERI